jgi:hypothetical protein
MFPSNTKLATTEVGIFGTFCDVGGRYDVKWRTVVCEGVSYLLTARLVVLFSRRWTVVCGEMRSGVECRLRIEVWDWTKSVLGRKQREIRM